MCDCNYSNSLHMCCYAMGPFKPCQGFFFLSFFLKPEYIISTYVSVSLPRFLILFQRSILEAKREWSVQKARSTCFPRGRPAALDLGLCVFYLDLLFPSSHMHKQASIRTSTVHMCSSSSRICTQGKSEHAQPEHRHAHACRPHAGRRFLTP